MTLEIIDDPAVKDDGHTYERTASNDFVVIGFRFRSMPFPLLLRDGEWVDHQLTLSLTNGSRPVPVVTFGKPDKTWSRRIPSMAVGCRIDNLPLRHRQTLSHVGGFSDYQAHINVEPKR